ncbi:MAG: TIGR00304 family membrane protein, partial [Nitrososphaeria archaeon]
LIFAGIVLMIVGTILKAGRMEKESEEEKEEGEEKEKKVKAGGIILIGPIPIVISNDRKLLEILLVIVIVILVIYLLFLLQVL